MGGKKFNPASANSRREAKRKAAEVAIQAIYNYNQELLSDTAEKDTLDADSVCTDVPDGNADQHYLHSKQHLEALEVKLQNTATREFSALCVIFLRTCTSMHISFLFYLSKKSF